MSQAQALDPTLLTSGPGATRLKAQGRFCFTLTVMHPVLGRLLHLTGRLRALGD